MTRIILIYILFVAGSLGWVVYRTWRVPVPNNAVLFNVPKGTRISCFANGKPHSMWEAQ